MFSRFKILIINKKFTYDTKHNCNLLFCNFPRCEIYIKLYLTAKSEEMHKNMNCIVLLS